MNPFTLKLILENARIVTQKAGAAPLYGPGGKRLCFYIVMRGWIAIDGPQGSCGEYGLGAIIGEEWLYSKSYTSRYYTAFCPRTISHQRGNEPTKNKALLLEISIKQYKQIRMHLLNPDLFRKYVKGQSNKITDKQLCYFESELKKDNMMLEAQIKRNYLVKKMC
jgi:hypothetical protein